MKKSTHNITQNNDIFYLKSHKEKIKGTIIYVHGFTSTYFLHHEFVIVNKLEDYNYFSMNFHNQDIMSQKTKFSELDINFYTNKLIEQIHQHNFNNIILIGHSMGGGICMLAYKQLASRIKKIILVNAINPMIFTSTVGFQYLFSVFSNNHRDIKMLEIKDKINESTNYKMIINEYLDYELERFIVNKHRFMYLGIKLLLPSLYKELDELYRTITIPTLFLSGQYDKIIPNQATKRYFKKIKNQHITFQTINNTKHIPFVENFEEYDLAVWKFINAK